MKPFHKAGLMLAIAAAFVLPINASAEDAAAPAASAAPVAAEQAAASPMQNMMREMRRDRDPSKCNTMKAASPDAPAPMPGMGMGMMGMGPGKGGMHGENCKTGGGMRGHDKPCMQGDHKPCHMRGDSDDARLDALERRMDMMQMMMEMMLRSSNR